MRNYARDLCCTDLTYLSYVLGDVRSACKFQVTFPFGWASSLEGRLMVAFPFFQWRLACQRGRLTAAQKKGWDMYVRFLLREHD